MAVNNIRIKYEINKCIGNKNCLLYAPKYFSFSKNKAHLKKARTENDVQYLDCTVDDAEFKSLIKAAKSCPVNVIGIIDIQNNKEIISNTVSTDDALEIEAKQFNQNQLKLDKAGYFLIKVNREQKTIEVGFCKQRNIVEIKITGKSPEDIYKTIVKRKLLTKLDHAAYLGNELQKAYIALKKNIDYVQDSELEL